MDIFDCAIKVEEKAKENYRCLEKDANLPEMRNLFSLLAAEEERHIERLDEMKAMMVARGVPLADLNEPACSLAPLEAKQSVLREPLDDPDYFLHAVKEEEEDIRYYRDLAADEDDAEMRLSLNLIAEEECKHLEVVENIYQFAEAPRTYLAWGEFSNLQDL